MHREENSSTTWECPKCHSENEHGFYICCKCGYEYVNETSVASIASNFKQETTSELLTVWENNQQDEYSKEAFVAVKQILNGRGISLPPQKKYVPKKSFLGSSMSVKSDEDRFALGLANDVLCMNVTIVPRELTFEHMDRKAYLAVGALGLCLTVCHDNIQKDHFVSWDDLRELRNETLTKKRFSANFGADTEDFKVLVKLSHDDALVLSKIFQRLPAAVLCDKCPACGGAVSHGRCDKCGRQFSSEMRKRGVLAIVIGTILASLGAVLTFGTLHVSKILGIGGFLIFWGLIVIGVIVALKGVLELLLGRKLV